ncbi:uncharacterized protein At1g24485-like [Magnolia sinica]|uniref:uncharacterized protein At1g24485-like n=1 Tax=Magnolia sinica TaxID=86752 RepID=UPI00265A17B9|nr:uncharacterized protein At1g24485-like [Magnolia sinica]
MLLDGIEGGFNAIDRTSKDDDAIEGPIELAQIYCVASLGIDCGSVNYVDSNGIRWYSDNLFIYPGNNSQVLINTTIASQQMSTLRFFPDRNKNCYILPVFAYRKWLLRAGFYYGNYDGQSRPPTFDLQFDGNLWATVTTSLDEPSFFEVIMIPTRENVSICLARTVDGGVPFISSLEILELGMNMYGWMQGNQVLFKEYRLNFGATEMVRYPDDEYDRFWDPAIPTGYKTVTADYPSLNQSVDDDPPLTVIKTAIEAPSPSDKIILSFPVPQQRSIYVTLYFTEVHMQ